MLTFLLYTEDVTFFGVESHSPICCPFFKVFKVVLEGCVVFTVVNFSIQ